METLEMRFPIAVRRHRMTDHKRSKNVTKELEITGIETVMKRDA
jgi:hypothetical protein